MRVILCSGMQEDKGVQTWRQRYGARTVKGDKFLSVEIKRQGTEMSYLSTVAVLPHAST